MYLCVTVSVFGLELPDSEPFKNLGMKCVAAWLVPKGVNFLQKKYRKQVSLAIFRVTSVPRLWNAP